MHLAARYGNEETAKLLIRNGAEIDGKVGWGWTALFDAVIAGPLMVMLLVLEGIDVEAEESEGKTALYFAAYELS